MFDVRAFVARVLTTLGLLVLGAMAVSMLLHALLPRIAAHVGAFAMTPGGLVVLLFAFRWLRRH